jgi:hypothetical protein
LRLRGLRLRGLRLRGLRLRGLRLRGFGESNNCVIVQEFPSARLYESYTQTESFLFPSEIPIKSYPVCSPVTSVVKILRS